MYVHDLNFFPHFSCLMYVHGVRSSIKKNIISEKKLSFKHSKLHWYGMQRKRSLGVFWNRPGLFCGIIAISRHRIFQVQNNFVRKYDSVHRCYETKRTRHFLSTKTVLVHFKNFYVLLMYYIFITDVNVFLQKKWTKHVVS